MKFFRGVGTRQRVAAGVAAASAPKDKSSAPAASKVEPEKVHNPFTDGPLPAKN